MAVRKRLTHEANAHNRRSTHGRARRPAAPMIARPWTGLMRFRGELKIPMKKIGKRIAGA